MKTVLLGVITELGTDIGNGVLKRNSGNTDWEQVLPKDILSAASGDISVNSQKLINLADATLSSGGNRVIKIAANDDSRSLTIKTGDEITGSTGSGDLIMDVGVAAASAGKLKLGTADAAEVWLGRAAGKLAFFGATAIVQNATEFTLNTNSNLSYNLPDGASTLEVEKCLRQLLTYLGNVSGLGLVHVHTTT